MAAFAFQSLSSPSVQFGRPLVTDALVKGSRAKGAVRSWSRLVHVSHCTTAA